MNSRTTGNNNDSWLFALAKAIKQRVTTSIEVDDLVQEGRLAVWILTLSCPEADSSAHRCKAQYAMLDYVRSSRLWDPVVVAVRESDAPDSELDNDPQAVYEVKQAFHLVALILTDNVREAFDMALQGHDIVEIANYFDISPARVCQMLAKARITLEVFLTNKVPYLSADEQVVGAVVVWLDQLKKNVIAIENQLQ